MISRAISKNVLLAKKLLMLTNAYLVAAAVLGCTRETSKDSNIKISIPAQLGSKTLGANSLMHVAINVTGPGIQNPVIFSWDSHQNGMQTVAPTNFNFNVPKGDNRFIQVLGVYEDPSMGGMLFRYGDSYANLQGGEAAVTVSLGVIGSGLILDGQISGRYLTGPDSGPTGVVEMFFNPGNGKRSLIVDKSFMANGWFSMFSLTGVNLEYKVNGMTLFGGPINLDSPQFFPRAAHGNLDKVMRAALPTRVRSEGMGQKSFEKASIYVWGFWSGGGSLAGKTVCNDLSAGAFTRIFQYNSIPNNASTLLTTSNSPTTEINFPANPALQNTGAPSVDPMDRVTAAGGDSTTCQPAITANEIQVKKQQVDGNGNDSVAGFRNIFLMGSNGSPFSMTPTGNSATISGTVLPGIYGLYDKIRFYRRIGAPNENFRMETPACQAIASGIAGFTFVGESGPIAANGNFMATSVGIDTTSPAFSSGGMSIVACGAAGPNMAPIGLFQQMYSQGGGGGKYFRIELNAPNSGMNYLTTNSQCYPINFKLYNNGMLENATSAVTIANINPGSTWYNIYTDSACSANYAGGSLTINSGSNAYSGAQLYFKPLSNGSSQQFSGVTVTGSDNFSFTPSQNMVDVASPSFSISGPSSILAYSAASPYCYEVKVSRLDAAGYPLPDPNPISPGFSLTGGGAVLYPSQIDCNNSTNPYGGTVTFAAGIPSMNLFLRVGSPASVVLNINTAGPFTGYSHMLNAYSAGIGHSALGSKFILSPVSQKSGLCNGLNIFHVNSAGDSIPTSSAIGVTLQSNLPDVVFFSDPACSNLLPDNKINFPSGQTAAMAYFVPLLSVGTNFVLSGGAGATLAPSVNVSVGTPSPSEEPYATFSIPRIKSVLLGSHDFAVPKTITFNLSPGATISCQESVSPYSSWSNCSGGQMVGNVFTWYANDAVSSLGFQFIVNAPGKSPRTYKFVPEQLFRKWGQNFSVLSCSQTINPNGTTDITSINTSLAANSVLCLNAGTYNNSTPAGISASTNNKLIGATNASGDPTSTLQAGATTDLITVGGTSPTFANLILNAGTSGSPATLLYINGSGGIIKSYNNIYQVAQYHYNGMKKISTSSFESYGDTYDINASSSSASGINISCAASCGAGTTTTLKTPKFRLTSHASIDSTFATGIYLYGSAATVAISEASVDPSANSGSFISSDGNSTVNSATINLSSSNIKISGYASNLNRFPIFLKDRVNFSATDVQIENMTTADAIRSIVTTSSTHNLSFINSKVINHQDQLALYINHTSYTATLTTTDTHFIRVGNAGATASAVQGATLTSLTWQLAGPTISTPNTYFCGSAGTNFANAYSGTGTPTYSGGFTPPSAGAWITNSVNAVDLACQP